MMSIPPTPARMVGLPTAQNVVAMGMSPGDSERDKQKRKQKLNADLVAVRGTEWLGKGSIVRTLYNKQPPPELVICGLRAGRVYTADLTC